jgi:hypothetical protein
MSREQGVRLRDGVVGECPPTPMRGRWVTRKTEEGAA